MLKFVSYDVVFQEVPHEITLAINLSRCPNRCKGCHSPHLMGDIGEILDENAIDFLLQKYSSSVTCFCFMGGDNDPKSVEQLAKYVKQNTSNRIKTAWYSGKPLFPKDCSLSSFDFLKIGPYLEAFGALDSPYTNQRFYKIENGKMFDKTELFKKEKFFEKLI